MNERLGELKEKAAILETLSRAHRNSPSIELEAAIAKLLARLDGEPAGELMQHDAAFQEVLAPGPPSDKPMVLVPEDEHRRLVELSKLIDKMQWHDISLFARSNHPEPGEGTAWSTHLPYHGAGPRCPDVRTAIRCAVEIADKLTAERALANFEKS